MSMAVLARRTGGDQNEPSREGEGVRPTSIPAIQMSTCVRAPGEVGVGRGGWLGCRKYSSTPLSIETHVTIFVDSHKSVIRVTELVLY